MADIEVGVTTFRSRIVVVLHPRCTAVRSRSLAGPVVDRMSVGVRGDERQTVRETLLHAALQGMEDRGTGLFGDADAAEAIERSTGSWNDLVDVAVSPRFQQVVANVGDVHEQPLVQFVLDTEVPLFRIRVPIVLGQRIRLQRRR